MLIITRKENESIILDINGTIIEITVADIGKQVRLGIAAPKECKIWRKELYATILENRQALSDASSENVLNILRKITHEEVSE